MPTLFSGVMTTSVDESGLDPEDIAGIIQIMRYPNIALHGIGFGGFSNATLPIVAELYNATAKNFSIEDASSFARNLFIECLFSSGIVGIYGIFVFAKNIFRHFRKDPVNYQILLIFIASSFLLRSNEPIFFTCIGLSVSLNYLVSVRNYSSWVKDKKSSLTA
jgi:hypothetical protein